jgi:hypothetical protein
MFKFVLQSTSNDLDFLIHVLYIIHVVLRQPILLNESDPINYKQIASLYFADKPLSLLLPPKNRRRALIGKHGDL